MLNSWILLLFVVGQACLLQPAEFKNAKNMKDYVYELPSNGASQQNKALIESVFKALEGLLDFYDREHKNLIIDGVFGLRVLEGVAKKVFEADQKRQMSLSSRLKRRLRELQSRATIIAKMSIHYLKKENPDYFEVMGFTAVEAWDNIKPLRSIKLDKTVMETNKNDDQIKMDESEQDQCFRGLAGDKKNGKSPCMISKHCWKVNTARGKSGYFLTHQLLYFLVGQVKGCSKVFEAKLKLNSFKGGMDKLLSQRCQLMYFEMLKTEEKANEQKYLEYIDLYMEQGVVCGMLGYAQFFSFYRLEMILGWIHPSEGCFGYSETVKRVPDNEEEDEDNEESDSNKKTMRQLKVSKDLKGGCEVHSTAVGTGLLALYLRWLLHNSKFPPSDINPNSYNEAGYFIKHRYLGTIPNVKTILIVVVIFVLVLIVFAKKMLHLRIPKSLWVYKTANAFLQKMS